MNCVSNFLKKTPCDLSLFPTILEFQWNWMIGLILIFSIVRCIIVWRVLIIFSLYRIQRAYSSTKFKRWGLVLYFVFLYNWHGENALKAISEYFGESYCLPFDRLLNFWSFFDHNKIVLIMQFFLVRRLVNLVLPFMYCDVQHVFLPSVKKHSVNFQIKLLVIACV